MHVLAPYTVAFDKFQRDIVVLEALQTRTQGLHLHRIRKTHLDAGINSIEIVYVIIKRGFDHLEAEGLLGVLVEAAHDPRHVDAFLVGIKTDSTSDRGLQPQVTVVAGMKADRQAKV